MKIGIANSVYKEEGYNHLKTLELSVNLNLEYVQSYLDSYTLKDAVLLKESQLPPTEVGGMKALSLN